MKQIFLMSEIEKHFNIFTQFSKSLSDAEYKKIENEAFKLFRAFTGHNKQFFKSQACFISSSALHGFYFPNYQVMRCISFIKGIPFIILDDEN